VRSGVGGAGLLTEGTAVSTNTPIALVPNLATIVAHVEHLALQAHEFITSSKPTRSIKDWVKICTDLKRRLRQLQQFVDEMPPVLWDIAFAGRDGRGLGGQMQPEVWREAEAQRHANVLTQLANIKRALAAKSANTKMRRGAPKKYPRAMEMGVGLWAERKHKDVTIHRKCKEAFGAEEDIPDVDSFMRRVRGEAAKRRKQS
jgi:hypothetical protein